VNQEDVFYTVGLCFLTQATAVVLAPALKDRTSIDITWTVRVP